MRILSIALLCLCTLLSSASSRPPKASTGQTPTFFVAAHPDDIQLFVGNRAAEAAANLSVRSIWIIATAGDAGRPSNWWQAREAGVLASMERAIGWTQGSFPIGCHETRDTPLVNGHVVVRYRLYDRLGNERSAMYCLRLPDGNVEGNGFASNSNESLLKLMKRQIPAIHSVDGVATYFGISDVMITLDAIMTFERNDTDPTVHPWLNANEYSGMRDTNDASEDHTDHRVLGSILASFAYRNGYNRLWWQSYSVRSGGGYTTLSGLDLTNKRAAYNAYTHAMDTMLTFFDGQNPSWAWGGSPYELEDRLQWCREWNKYGDVMHVYSRSYSTPDPNNHYPLTYP